MIHWTGAMTVTQTENGIVCRWWEGTKERSRNFAHWYDAAHYMELGFVLKTGSDAPKIDGDGPPKERNPLCPCLRQPHHRGSSTAVDPMRYGAPVPSDHHPAMAEALHAADCGNY